MVADISYTANASEVGRLIKANPDALMHASYITDAILFTKTFKAMGFNPKEHADKPVPLAGMGKVG